MTEPVTTHDVHRELRAKHNYRGRTLVGESLGRRFDNFYAALWSPTGTSTWKTIAVAVTLEELLQLVKEYDANSH